MKMLTNKKKTEFLTKRKQSKSEAGKIETTKQRSKTSKDTNNKIVYFQGKLLTSTKHAIEIAVFPLNSKECRNTRN